MSLIMLTNRSNLQRRRKEVVTQIEVIFDWTYNPFLKLYNRITSMLVTLETKMKSRNVPQSKKTSQLLKNLLTFCLQMKMKMKMLLLKMLM